MKLTWRNSFKALGYTAGTVVGLVGLYLGSAFVLERIPVDKVPTDEPADIELFLLSNGVHTDLVLPVKTAQIDWSRQVKYTNTHSADSSMGYVGFGWGDKGFYLDTPTWAQLKFSTAFKAMFYLSTSAMHTTFYHGLRPGPSCIALRITRSQYAQLIEYIQASFRRDAAGQVQLIAGHSYGNYDAFYEAKRIYNLFYTCNIWANNGLKIAGQKASLWTPFDSGIFYQYGK